MNESRRAKDAGLREGERERVDKDSRSDALLTCSQGCEGREDAV